MLSRAITLVESRAGGSSGRWLRKLLVELLPHAGGAHRVGITGVPGVGKSTFVDALGSSLTGGRAPGRGARRRPVVHPQPAARSWATRRACPGWPWDPAAFIRPSPTSGTLGGVAKATPREPSC